MDSKFDKFESRFNSNDDLLRKMHNDINEQKIKCEQQNIKNDDNFKEIKVRFDNLIKQTQDDVDNVTRNTGKCSGNVTENKVSTDNYSNELTNDNEIIKKEIY